MCGLLGCAANMRNVTMNVTHGRHAHGIPDRGPGALQTVPVLYQCERAGIKRSAREVRPVSQDIGIQNNTSERAPVREATAEEPNLGQAERRGASESDSVAQQRIQIIVLPVVDVIGLAKRSILKVALVKCLRCRRRCLYE